MSRVWEALTHHLGLKLVSVLVACLLWIIILGSKKVEVDKEVPIRVLSSDEVLPANEIPDKVTFRLSGPKVLLKQVLERNDDPIELNLSQSRPGLVTYRFFTDDLRVPPGVRVLSINPTAAFVRLESVSSRMVPVFVDLQGKLPEGYELRRVEVTPATVQVKGAESRVKKIKEIKTKPIQLDSLEKNIEQLSDLDLASHGVSLAGDPPRLLVEIEPVEANFKIGNVPVRVLSGLKASVSDQNVMLYVRARPDDLRALDRSGIFASINLQGKQKGKYVRKVLVDLPPSISIVRIVPQTVTVTLD